MNLTDVEFREGITVFQDSVNLPWYISHAFFWVTTVLVLSWPFRIFVAFKSVHIQCVVEKVFGARYDSSNGLIPSGGGVLDPAGHPVGLTVDLSTPPPPHRDEVGPCEILPSYSDVMLSDGATNQNRPSSTTTKVRSVSIQVEPKRSESRTSFSHIIEDEQLNLVACTHEGSQSHQMTLSNLELNPRYQRNRWYRIKCQSFNDRFVDEDDEGRQEEQDPQQETLPRTIMRKSKSFVTSMKPLSPLCESLLTDNEM